MECLMAHFPYLLRAVTLSTATVVSSSPFRNFTITTLALKNCCLKKGFLNSLYLCPRIVMFGANSKNLPDFQSFVAFAGYIILLLFLSPKIYSHLPFDEEVVFLPHFRFL